MTLHLLIRDKFTEPFYHYITEVLKLADQQFLFVSETATNFKPAGNLSLLRTPLGKNMGYNLRLFFRLCSKADRIILHGDPLLHFFVAAPFFRKKIHWIIYGQELHSLDSKGGKQNWIKRFVLSKVKNHITHIKGDSELANKLLESKADFVYSPMYLSNVADVSNFNPSDIAAKGPLRILVGSSTDPTNNQEEIFKKIAGYAADIETVYCPLSYGMYNDYKRNVIREGREIFGEKFVVMDKFMPFAEYRKFLSTIDIAIFDHNRQEAMGVTLTLLGLGKIVYMNPNTTSYESLTRRGFRIFDNNLIEKQGLKINRDVSENVHCLETHYSKAVFDASWVKISQL